MNRATYDARLHGLRKAILAALVIGAGVGITANSVQAHSDSVGFKKTVSATTTCIAGTGTTCYDVEVFFGTYHGGLQAAEGDLAIFIQNTGGTETQIFGPSAAGGARSPFSMNHSLIATLPNGTSAFTHDYAHNAKDFAALSSVFAVGSDYFFSTGTGPTGVLVASPTTPGVSTVASHQSAVAVGLGAGTYRIAYDPAYLPRSAIFSTTPSISSLKFTIGAGGGLVVATGGVDTIPPVITGPGTAAGAATSAITVNEKQTAVTTFTANEAVTWSIIGGADQSKFSIDTATGTITFLTAPDFAAPTDADLNNTYIADVQATDTAGNTSSQTLTVTIRNVINTPGELFGQEKTKVLKVVQGLAVDSLRANMASTRNQTFEARTRFINAHGGSAGCGGGESNSPCNTGLASRNNVPLSFSGSASIIGAASASATDIASRGAFFQQSGNYNGTKRRLFFGDFNMVKTSGSSVSSALNMKVAWEHDISDKTMLGYYIGASAGSANVTGTLAGSYTGTQNGFGLSVGGYFVSEIGNNLYADGYASVGMGSRQLNITNGSLALADKYNTGSVQLGATISGVIKKPGYEIAPEISVNYGQTNIGALNMSATAFSLVAPVTLNAGQISVLSLSVAPAFKIPLKAKVAGLSNTKLTFAPRLTCEYVSTSASTTNCGGGMSVGFSAQSSDGLSMLTAKLQFERIGSTTLSNVQVRARIQF